MNHHAESDLYDEKHANDIAKRAPNGKFGGDPENHAVVVADQNALHRELKGRHMQMIAM